MLTLKAGQEVRIGNGVTVRVCRTGRGTVRLGIDAPRSEHIQRGPVPADEPAAKHGRPGNDGKGGDTTFIGERNNTEGILRRLATAR